MDWRRPDGYLLTWTTYGTWLHGDERGSYNRKGKTSREHFIPPNIRLETYRRSLLKFPALLLDAEMRRIVRLALEECCDHRKWVLHAQNVRTNHVHAVVPTASSADRMLHDLKAIATRRLREKGLIAPDRSVWTSGGSKTLQFSERGVAAACEYVINDQGKPLPEE